MSWRKVSLGHEPDVSLIVLEHLLDFPLHSVLTVLGTKLRIITTSCSKHMLEGSVQNTMQDNARHT